MFSFYWIYVVGDFFVISIGNFVLGFRARCVWLVFTFMFEGFVGVMVGRLLSRG